MHSALVVATIPDNRRQWDAFLGFLNQKIGNAKSAVWLAENVWLVNLQEPDGPGALGQILATAQNQTVSCGLLPFAQRPEWLPAEFCPSTIQGQNAG